MISFEKFVMQEGSPIYQQILLYIKRGVIAGVIEDGEEDFILLNYSQRYVSLIDWRLERGYEQKFMKQLDYTDPMYWKYELVNETAMDKISAESNMAREYYVWTTQLHAVS